jgi:acyl-[acyl-carrier-protein]-phospholipid O-acyltransferase/long-chain-fatty-acid--[acyl-carrier-protein] ligase
MRTGPLLETFRLPGFRAYLLVAFINAVIDLGHKIIIQNTLFKVYDDSTQVALTSIVNGMILLPYALLFTPAGFVSDRYAKAKLMRFTSIIAVGITLLITLSYYQGWFMMAFSLTLLLAIQSAFYSPAKYGYAREIAGEDKLVAANGFIQATSMIAILTGMFAFTILFEWRLGNGPTDTPDIVIRQIAPLGWGLFLLSLLELRFAWKLTQKPPANVDQQFDWQAYTRGQTLKTNIEHLTQQSTIWYAVLALGGFWAVSQTLLATFPAFAKLILLENNTIIVQGILACAGVGIVSGAFIAGRYPQGIKPCVTIGSALMLLVLIVVPFLSNTLSFILAMLCFGLGGGLFVVPLYALIQRHAPQHVLGTILAGTNWVHNWMMLSALALTFFAARIHISSHTILYTLPILTLLFTYFVYAAFLKQGKA